MARELEALGCGWELRVGRKKEIRDGFSRMNTDLNANFSEIRDYPWKSVAKEVLGFSLPLPPARANLSFLVDSRFILVTLLVKLGVAAAVTSAVVRSRYFKELCSTKSAHYSRRFD